MKRVGLIYLIFGLAVLAFLTLDKLKRAGVIDADDRQSFLIIIGVTLFGLACYLWPRGKQ